MAMSMGGYRIKTKLTLGQALLLDALWVKHGGITLAAKKLKLPPQTLNNWRKKGLVPPKSLKKVSEVLGEHPASFNYSFYNGIVPGTPSWEEIVKKCKLAPPIEEQVLGGKWPK